VCPLQRHVPDGSCSGAITSGFAGRAVMKGVRARPIQPLSGELSILRRVPSVARPRLFGPWRSKAGLKDAVLSGFGMMWQQHQGRRHDSLKFKARTGRRRKGGRDALRSARTTRAEI
jgi:hypothetical protein